MLSAGRLATAGHEHRRLPRCKASSPAASAPVRFLHRAKRFFFPYNVKVWQGARRAKRLKKGSLPTAGLVTRVPGGQTQPRTRVSGEHEKTPHHAGAHAPCSCSPKHASTPGYKKWLLRTTARSISHTCTVVVCNHDSVSTVVSS